MAERILPGEEAGGEGSLQSQCGGERVLVTVELGRPTLSPAGQERANSGIQTRARPRSPEPCYIRLRDGEYHMETIPLKGPGLGAGVDVDAEGNVLGFEFLSFAEYAQLIDQAGGSLQEVPEQLKRRPTTRTSPP